MKPLAVRQIRTGYVLELWVGENAAPMSILDFHAAGFSEVLAEATARSFVALQGGNAVESQNANWRLVRSFGYFLSKEYGYVKKFPADCLKRFGKYLEATGTSLKTTGAAYNAAYRTLNWLLRNIPDVIDRNIRLERGQAASLAKSSPTSRNNPPDAEVLAQILACCYADIEASEAARVKFRLLPLSEEPILIADVLRSLLGAGGGMLATAEQLKQAPKQYSLKKSINECGGLREIYSKYYLSIEDLFPYYLAILIQASANPQSLRLAEMDCIMPVPFRDDLERFVWLKQRSRRLQIPEFHKDKKWSAPNIARMLLDKNFELRHLAVPAYSDALFICRTVSMKVTVPSWQEMHNCLIAFRKKHNLPHFDLGDLRRSGAILHHKAGRSIASAQQRLQHKSPKVTQNYTSLSDRTIDHQSQIRKFQGIMIQETQRFNSGEKAVTQKYANSCSSAETLFGFGCKDPLAGIAEGSRPGVACPKFNQCSGCSGAIVVVDDPVCVAKLVAASRHLAAERDRAVKEGWSKRFDVLYQATMDILRNNILPAVSKPVLNKAMAIRVPPLPRLE
ncbi:hypothetical protein [Acidovorax sp. Leaf73]|uniref:hypothetical protein n=1 Tax=Acidovorax sp. Leaf73 TaxID=2876566 RepID=UPI001E2B852C|nr:hypothetical protein [Acidovorax sp. Leaf73]